MNIFKLIIILQLFSIAYCYASKDRAPISLDTLQNRTLKTSELIFLGKLIRTDKLNTTLVFDVLEVFKGKISTDTIEIKWERHTNVYSVDYSLWIVYANKMDGTSYVLNYNGLSRSIDHPEYLWAYQLPPRPPSKHEANTVLKNNMKWMEVRKTALSDWYVELGMLREYRKNNIESDNNRAFDLRTYFYISILLNLICIGLIVFVIRKFKISLRLLTARTNGGNET